MQTATAISAGISQSKRSNSDSQPDSVGSLGSTQSSGFTSRSASEDTSISQYDRRSAEAPPAAQNKKKRPDCVLRLDAFLGEWLTPDYFEQIPPPPGSVMMVASAKADLLRPAEKVELSSPAEIASATGFFPGGWNRSPLSSTLNARGPIDSAQTLPTRNRSGTLGEESVGGLHAAKRPLLSKISTNIPDDLNRYVPPTPTYAVKPTDPIPRGYVAHAREACMEVDYQWDSMREPQDWGTGGEYGEEWSSMHERFRRGLERMVAWYKSNGTAHFKDRVMIGDSDDGNEDVDTVLILVTHGAGCNALIGALTSRPALLDIGISSMTMAVQKEPSTGLGSGSMSQLAGSSVTPELANEYDVKVLSSTEHWRPVSSGAGSNAVPSRAFPTQDPLNRQRFGSISNSVNSRNTFSMNDSSTQNFSLPRIPHHASSRSMFVSRSSPGLWGSRPSDPVDDILPDFGDSKPTEAPLQKITSDNSAQRADPPLVSPTPKAPQANFGLWSSGDVITNREPVGKRRWTVTER